MRTRTGARAATGRHAGGREVVYVGTLHGDRLDVGLCEAWRARSADAAHSCWSGPNALPAAEHARLARAGVMLLGPRTRDEVIAYLQHADVLVVPHVVTAFTDSLDPIKLYEYQAVGRPVVSTAVAGFREADDDRIVIAYASDFPDAVARCAGCRGLPRRRGPRVADWDDRADAMLGILSPNEAALARAVTVSGAPVDAPKRNTARCMCSASDVDALLTAAWKNGGSTGRRDPAGTERREACSSTAGKPR